MVQDARNCFLKSLNLLCTVLKNAMITKSNIMAKTKNGAPRRIPIITHRVLTPTLVEYAPRADIPARTFMQAANA